MTKINIATQLNKAFTAAVRACLAADPALVDPRRYGAGRDAIAGEVTRLLGVCGAGTRQPGGRRSAGGRSSARRLMLDVARNEASLIGQ